MVKKHWQNIVSLFSNIDGLSSVILFGSRAKGNFRNGSDIDLCLKETIPPHVLSKIQEAYENLYLPWKLDVILWENVENEDLKEHIKRVGIEVYPKP